MKNSKTRLKKAIKKTTTFILNLEVNSSERIPEWFEQMALSSAHDGLDNSMYESLLSKLRSYIDIEYGASVSKHLLS